MISYCGFLSDACVSFKFVHDHIFDYWKPGHFDRQWDTQRTLKDFIARWMDRNSFFHYDVNFLSLVVTHKDPGQAV